jgi:hypothetical protein
MKAHERLADRIGILRSTHDELGHLIESDPKAAIKLLDKARDQLFEISGAYDEMLKRICGESDLVLEELVLHKAVRDAVAALEGSPTDVKSRCKTSVAEACEEYGVDASDAAKRTTCRMYMKVFASTLEALADWDSDTWNR